MLALISGDDPCARFGGHPSYVIAHALAARAAGFDSRIFCVGRADSVTDAPFGTVQRVAAPPRRTVVGPAFHGRLARAVAAYLESGHNSTGIAVIHGFGLWAGCAVATGAVLAGRGVATATVVSAYTTTAYEWRALLRNPCTHGDLRFWVRYARFYPWVHTVIRRVERKGYRGAQVVMVNYESVARLLREAHGPDLNIRRIPYAAPMAFCEDTNRAAAPPFELEAVRPLIVSVSRHDPRKGLDVLLRALSQLRDQQVPFRACLVGPGHLLDAHRRLAHELGLSGQVVIPGEVSDVRHYLHRADVFVLPSLQEGSGSVSLLEAMQAGTAIVASAVDGVIEDLEHGCTALLIPPGDHCALAHALGRLLADSKLRARLGSAARTLYETQFSAAAMTRALAEVYGDLGLVSAQKTQASVVPGRIAGEDLLSN